MRRPKLVKLRGSLNSFLDSPTLPVVAYPQALLSAGPSDDLARAATEAVLLAMARGGPSMAFGSNSPIHAVVRSTLANVSSVDVIAPAGSAAAAEGETLDLEALEAEQKGDVSVDLVRDVAADVGSGSGLWADSVIRKRKKKMNKHKLKKRRKLERFRSRRNTK